MLCSLGTHIKGAANKVIPLPMGENITFLEYLNNVIIKFYYYHNGNNIFQAHTGNGVYKIKNKPQPSALVVNV